MPVHVVRLGSPRRRGEGVRLGTVRFPPRGVPKADYARRNLYDVWLPELAPSAELIREFRDQPSDAAWARFAARYRREMAAPGAAHLIDALAALARQTSFAVGCYCEDEARCHRSLLRQLFEERGVETV